ncbi:triphosphoribosyl-dephospho-CoA synthase [Cytobacillus depressus]|uniref:triphosphoribosyl-dephospho-CoA synthase n=1 Tax=Cytobacillus depressus TaxID=1602942 RepID=A0A6L3V7U4_9BACI|nr:triphosphoribosyl-dephospho-CoA synthase [Cytobacillus depressus]KAB2336667.1 triphosphoribosyl-dephospho-CoA synthase [Cytobacillus depressus]
MEKSLTYTENLAMLAVRALIEEAELTPKPGLVDKESAGSHHDMSIELMIKSAKSLEPAFSEIAKVSYGRVPSQELREEIAAIGRQGEKDMFQATGGVNTHKGAIWALGLLISSAAMNPKETSLDQIALTAGKLALFPDRNLPQQITNGQRVKEKYGVNGALEEAQKGFPHIREIALPVLYESRSRGIKEELCRLNTLFSLIASLDDTCILHRAGFAALTATKELSSEILLLGGVCTEAGWKVLEELSHFLNMCNASPGGSADLLAATIFLDYLYETNKSPLWGLKKYSLI